MREEEKVRESRKKGGGRNLKFDLFLQNARNAPAGSSRCAPPTARRTAPRAPSAGPPAWRGTQGSRSGTAGRAAGTGSARSAKKTTTVAT